MSVVQVVHSGQLHYRFFFAVKSSLRRTSTCRKNGIILSIEKKNRKPRNISRKKYFSISIMINGIMPFFLYLHISMNRCHVNSAVQLLHVKLFRDLLPSPFFLLCWQNFSVGPFFFPFTRYYFICPRIIFQIFFPCHPLITFRKKKSKNQFW